MLTAAAILCGCAPGHEQQGGAYPDAPQTSNDAPGANTDFEVAQPAPQLALRAVPGEYLIKFKRGVPRASAVRALGKASLKAARTYSSVPGLYLVRANDAALERAAFKADLAADPQVEYIEPNFIRRASAVPNDPDYPRLWAMKNTGQTGSTLPILPDIGAEAAWDVTTGSESVIVAVIDSGVDYNHEDLAANIWQNPGECDGDGVDDDNNGFIDDCHGIDTVEDDSNPMDEAGHGTHVAGIIGAVGNNGIGIAGLAWRVKILPCRFLDSQGSGADADAIECFDYLALLKQRGENIIASNNSWGSGENSRALADAIRAQRDLGILNVAAAGNDTQQDVDLIPQYPCAYDIANVMCVASAYDSVDIFSNFGRGTVLLGAPGYGIYSTIPGNRYDGKDGTSMATPHVTGALVLLAAQDPARSIWALRNLVVAGTVAPSQFSVPSVAEGRLNVHNSLTCINRVVLGRLRPMVFEPLSRAPGDPVTIRALHVRCATPNGNVAVSVAPSGETVTLRDNGLAPDEIAGDGVYAGNWIAHGQGEFTFSFPAPETETFKVDVDTALKPGFPRATFTTNFENDAYGVLRAGDVVAGNIAGDARLEVLSLAHDFGPLMAWDSRGEPLAGWPRYEPGEAVGLSLGNFDADPADLEPVANYFQGLRLYQGDGSLLGGWPVLAGTAFSTPAAADLDGDGVDEVISYPARRADGTPFRTDIKVPAYPEGDEGFAYAAEVADLDADGGPDFIALSSRSSLTRIWVSDIDGLRPGFPVPLPGGTDSVGARSTLIGDVDRDGILNIVVPSTDYPRSRGQVQIFDNRGVLLRTMYGNTFGNNNTGLADMDGDGVPEIVHVSNSEISVWRGDGSVLTGWPQFIDDLNLSDPAVGDIDGDGQVDLVVSGFRVEQFLEGQLSLHAFRADGTYLPGFPRFMHAAPGAASPPVIADLDLDGRNDLIVSFMRGIGLRETVFAYDLQGAGPYGPVEWSQKSGPGGQRAYYETGKNLPNHAYVATQVFGAGRITSDDGGISCRSDCLERYAKGTNVVLTARPNVGASFLRWRGACAGQGNPCTLPVNRFTQTSADFSSEVRVSLAGSGTGSVTASPTGIACPQDCSEVYAVRTQVTLTAVAPTGNYFEGWGGACSGTQTTCTIFMDDAKDVTANFTNRIPLTITKVGAGTATYNSDPAGIACSAPCTGLFTPGSTVILSVSPAVDSYVVGITYPGCFQTPQSCIVTMNGPQTVEVWVERKWRVSLGMTGSGKVTSNPAGLDCSASCNPYVLPGFASFDAEPAPGWRFVRWDGACSSAGFTRCVLQLSADAAISVVFERLPSLVVDFQGTGVGTVQSTGGISCNADCEAMVTPPQQVTLTATPAGNSTFGGWSGACTGTATTCQLNFTATTTVGATFSLIPPPPPPTNGGGGGGGGRLDLAVLVALGLMLAGTRRRRLSRMACRSNPAASRTRSVPSRPCGSNPPAGCRTCPVDRSRAHC